MKLLEIAVIELLFRFDRFCFKLLAGKGFRELCERILCVSALAAASERIRSTGVTLLIRSRCLWRNLLFEHIRRADGHQNDIVDHSQKNKANDDANHNLIQLGQKVQLEQVKRYIQLEKRILDVKV